MDFICPYKKNLFYWQYKGKPVLLLGGSDEDNLFQWTGSQLTEHLDLLCSVGGNYVRNVMSDRDKGNVFPFMRVNGNQYDLMQWNEEYWNRFDNFLRETIERQIFVQIELWDAFDWHGANWECSPWNPKNNVNYTYQESGLPQTILPSPHHAVHTFVLTIPGLSNCESGAVVLPFQRRFAKRVMEVSLRYDHVLYCIHNETSASQSWSDYWAQFIHDEAKVQGMTAYVSDMRESDRLTARLDPQQYQIKRHELYTYLDVCKSNRSPLGQDHWDEVQQIRTRLKENHPRPMNVVKLMQRHFPMQASVDRWWRNLFGGIAAIRFHRPGNGLGLTQPAQVLIKGARVFTDQMNIFACEPHNDLLYDRNPDEAYCMAELGKQYAVYLPTGGSVNLDLSNIKGKLVLRWLSIKKGSWTKEEEVMAKPMVTLTTPSDEGWAVLILKAEENKAE